MHPYLKRFIEFAGTDFDDDGYTGPTDKAIGVGLRQVIEWVKYGTERGYFDVIPDGSGGLVFMLTKHTSERTTRLCVHDDGDTSIIEFEGSKLVKREVAD